LCYKALERRIDLVMFRLSFHPAFFVYALVLTLQGKYIELTATVFAAVLHEIGHATIAYNRGYSLNKIVIMPYGAVLYGGEKIARSDAVQIAVAGPIVSLMLAALTTALWWLFPATYPYTEMFRNINIGIALFNLIPVYPLDGGRIIMALAKKPITALKYLRIAGEALAFLMLAGFIATAFFKINYSLGIMSVMVYLSATSGTEKESYRHIALPYMKDRSHPIHEVAVIVSHDLRLIELLKLIKSNKIIKFKLTDENGIYLKDMSEDMLAALCIAHPLNTKIKDCPEYRNF